MNTTVQRITETIVRREAGDIRVVLGGAPGPRGLPSGPLGAGSVGAEELATSVTDRLEIISTLGFPDINVDLFPSVAAAFAVAAVLGGGTLRFGVGRYTHPWTTPAARIAQANIRLVGAGRPSIASGRNRLQDGTGTILEGPLYFWADNFHLDGLGVDSGADVCSASFGGVAQDGIASFKPGQTAWNAITSPNKRGLTVRNVVALCQSAGAPVHAALFEAYDYADISDVETCYGLHGFVGKLRFSNIRGVRGYGHAGSNPGEGESFLLKGNTYAPLTQVNATGIVAEGGTYPNDNGIGIQVLAEGVAGAGGVTISDFKVLSKAKGVDLSGANLADVTATGGLIETCPIGITFGSGIKRCSVEAIVNNSTKAVVAAGTGDLSNSFAGKITNVSATSAIDIGTSRLTVTSVYFEGVLASGANCINVSPGGRARIGKVTYKPGTILSLMNASPALANGWTAVGGVNTPFFVTYKDGLVQFSGVIQPGSSDIMFVLPEWLRPTVRQRLGTIAYDGTSSSAVARIVYVDTNGEVSIANRPTGTGASVSLDGLSYSDVLAAA